MSLIQSTNKLKTNITFVDSPSNDAFGRLRVSEPTTLIDSIFQYNSNPLYWQSAITGGSVTHIPAQSAIRLSATTASGNLIIRQTYEYFRYQPGRSQLVLMTGVMGSKKTNAIQRIGLFDGSDGLFFEQDGTNLKVVRRTSTSGTRVDNVVNQSSWNLNKLDGTGENNILIDTSKTQIFVIDFEWLGVGRARFGVNIDGITYHCHEFRNANNLSTVYMKTANLPLRYELRTSGTTSTPTTMDQLCSVVTSEGGSSDFIGLQQSVSNGSGAGISVATRRSVLAIRPKATFNSIINRGKIIPESFNIYPDADIFYEIIYGGALGGSPSWTSAGANSIVEFDVAGTTVTGGEIIDSGYIPTTTGNQISFSRDFGARLPLALDINGANPPNLCIVGTTLGGGAAVRAAFRFKEQY